MNIPAITVLNIKYLFKKFSIKQLPHKTKFIRILWGKP